MQGDRTMIKATVRANAVRVAALAVVGLPLAACFPTSEWRPTEAQRTGSVELVQMDHRIHFAPGDATLTGAERGRLDLFVDSVDTGYGDSVSVRVIGDDDLSVHRGRLVQGHLQARNVKSRLIAQPQAPGYGRVVDSVELNIARYTAIPPKCGDWTKNAGQDIYNSTSSGIIGCPNAYALTMMVADPGDLVRGRRMGPGDGEAQALAIGRYQRGEVTPIKVEDIRTSESQQ